MNPTPSVGGLRCGRCSEAIEADRLGRCPACDGPLTFDIQPDGLTRSTFAATPLTTLARFESVLPVDPEQLDALALSVGGTPLVDVPTIADECDLERVSVKDEGRNPTGSLFDRSATLAVGAAVGTGAPAVGLPSAGPSAHAVAAQAALAGIDSHSFVPSRAGFDTKAMINVHGGDMTVVPGDYADAAAAYADAAPDADWFPAGAFATPYPIEGTKTVAYELALQREWTPPDAVVAPVGHGAALAGLAKGFDELRRFGLVDEEPRLFAAQPAGCAPVVTAWERERSTTAPIDHPDTVCGPLAIPTPAGGDLVLRDIRRTDGGAVAVEDDESLDAAVTVAERTGLAASVAGGIVVRATQVLATEGVLGPTADVVLLDPLAGSTDADLLRSHLMRTGR